jgi:hypothetical protein
MSSKDAKDHEAAPIDVRSLERDLKRGKMTRKEHEKLLKPLPDVKAKSVSMADIVPVHEPAASDDLDDDEDDLDDEGDDADEADDAPPADDAKQ